ICHVGIGRASFDEKSVVENYSALIDEINRVKPASSKGRYIKSVTMASTMSPGVKVDPLQVRDLLAEA
ncbi:MAG: 50S ribosomal protein L1, partial [Actinomycetota bacterium]|nr:50S ribosomal protein L1 [Actinomycetota bacterium]